MQAESSRPEIRLQGTAAAPGVGRGPAYLLLQGMAIVACQKVPDVEAELRAEIAHLRHQLSEQSRG